MLEGLYTTKMSSKKNTLEKRFLKICSTGSKISKLMCIVTTIFISITMLFATVVMATIDNNGETEPITLYSHGEAVELINKPFISENMVYFPLRETFEKLGVFEIDGNELTWDNGEIVIKVSEAIDKDAVFYTIKIGSDMIGIKHTKDQRIPNPGDKPVMNIRLSMPEEKPLMIGDTTYVPYTFIKYMLNNGLGLTNKNEIFDFMFVINEKPQAAFLSQHLCWPCDGDISNPFGEKKNPATNEVIKHNGIDIVAPEGTDVKSAIYGTVTDAGYNAEKGNFIIIERDNIKTVYAGLKKDFSVKKGDEVLRGKNIGKVGKTGMSTGAHLHFEVIINGEYFNPELIK